MISGLARTALTASPPSFGAAMPQARFGFRPFPQRGGIVTNEMIDKLREDDAD